MAAATRATPAGRRAVFHRERIGGSGSQRERAWRAVGWLVAEGKRRPLDGFEGAVDEVVAIAERLNRSNEDDGQ